MNTVWPNPKGFDHDAWMRLNSPLSAAAARTRGLCPGCGGTGRLYFSYADEHGYILCHRCQQPQDTPGLVHHRPAIVSQHTGSTGWTYQARCTCGHTGRRTPHRAAAAHDRAMHIAAVAAPDQARCTTPGLHGHPWWEACTTTRVHT
ncbi:hypothetical protein [Nocardiopsis sp. YSL2]|uniref:hypothetical protein n=1 Tax=Nocardiopsis sp. YSL2 TaxID=2939492 RepID=UPI0026F42145|nr:hypothetical protein [Nocardiopsis sp. YSL2]